MTCAVTVRNLFLDFLLFCFCGVAFVSIFLCVLCEYGEGDLLRLCWLILALAGGSFCFVTGRSAVVGCASHNSLLALVRYSTTCLATSGAGVKS